MNRLHRLILIFILLIASFLRLYNISNVSPSASLDEASIGWNAYSILKTGTDEYGNKFPLLLRAYDDWRPALYVYLVIPFVKVFGLSILAVRLPSVLLSILTVVATYFLVKEIFFLNSSSRGLTSIPPLRWNYIDILVASLISALLLAISPWHVYISRLGHEANAGLAFFVFGMLFFVKNKIHKFFVFFALSFVSYQAEKIFLPIFLIGLLIIFRRELLVIKRQVIIASLVAFVILLPFLIESLQPNALIRFKATSVFGSQNKRYESQAELFARAVENNDLLGKIIYNRRIVPIQIFAESYMSHFNPKWLFTNLSSDRHKVPNLGLLYLFEVPLILIGLLYLFSKQFNHRARMLILLWILFSPFPGAITTDAPHAMRAYTMLPAPQILAAIGALHIWKIINALNLLKNRMLLLSVSALSLLITVGSIVYMFRQYFSVFPKEQSASFQLALAQTIPFVLEHESKYNKVIFSNRDNLYQSYMFFLFYSKYDPFLYKRQGGTKSGGFAETHKFAKYEFRPIVWSKDKSLKNTLFVGNTNEFSNQVPSLASFTDLDGKGEVKVVKN